MRRVLANARELIFTLVVCLLIYSIAMLSVNTISIDYRTVASSKDVFAETFVEILNLSGNPFVSPLTIEDVIVEQEEKKEEEVKKKQDKPPEIIANGKELIFPTGQSPPKTWDIGIVGGKRKHVDLPEMEQHSVVQYNTFKYMLGGGLWVTRNSILLALEQYPNTNYGKSPDAMMTINIPPYGDCLIGAITTKVSMARGDIIEVKTNSKVMPVIHYLVIDHKSMSHTPYGSGLGGRGGKSDLGPAQVQGVLGHGLISHGKIQINPLEVVMTKNANITNGRFASNGGWLKQSDWKVLSLRRVGHIKGMTLNESYALGESNPKVNALIDKWKNK